MKIIRIHPSDNVAVALSPVTKGESLSICDLSLTAREDIPQGHKFALNCIAAGQPVVKYGFPIGAAKEEIAPGQWVHTHNVKTRLSGELEYTYQPAGIDPLPAAEPASFMGYLRNDGRAAVRNELWIIPTVGCVNSVAEQLVQRNQHLVQGSIDGLYAFPHPYGCSQMGDDHENTKKLLCALARHPNAGGVLVLGLGCENLTMAQFKEELGDWDEERVKFLTCQEVSDEYEEGGKLLEQLAQYAGQFRRQRLPASKLIIGMKCGGSDGLSGITANPTVGAFSDLLIAQGGSTILTEVPEMFGAETILMDRCQTTELFEKTVSLINDFKRYFEEHHQTIYENPSPGNKAGGISTLEDKALGCTQKSGFAPVKDVLKYGQKVEKQGLNLLSAPGNDLVAATALAASGSQIVLFSTGRGTPFASPVPTIKIASNETLANKKSNWIDFNAGRLLSGMELPELAQDLMDYVIRVASGEQVCSEKNGYHDLAIFKTGVTL